jgi:hypothetical protein
MEDLSIVIVNYCGWDSLKKCLESIKKITQQNFTFEVIIVDNSPKTILFNQFSKEFENFKFYKNTENYGFANGCNKGASLANGNYLLFLNPDTIVSKESIELLVLEAKQNSDYGIISCQTTNGNGKSQDINKLFPSLATFSGFSRIIYRLFNNYKLRKKFQPKENKVFPDWVSGCVLLIEKNIFNKIGGWNEDYWLYYEDVDICKKVHDLGKKVVVLQQTSIIHQHGKSTRINLITKALTKTEVLISRHVYINNHFTGFYKNLLQFITVLSTITGKLLIAIISTFLFFIPKLRINWLIFGNIITYYSTVFIYKSWLSNRSINFSENKELALQEVDI